MLRHVSALPWSPIGAEWFVFNTSASMAASIAGGPPLPLPRRLKRFDIRRPTPFIFAFILARFPFWHCGEKVKSTFAEQPFSTRLN
jgi:hypothetical protein